MLGKAIFRQLIRQPQRPLSVHLTATRQPHWQAYLYKRYDRATGEWKYVDWEEIIRGVEEPHKNGQWELERHWSQKRHLKPNVVRQRKKDRKEYNVKVKKIEDLVKYIQFMKDHPDDFDETPGSRRK